MRNTRARNAPLKDIVIVGGGTAGWMTAALLSKLLSRHYVIRLVESDEIGTIGVGEATIPSIRTFLQLAGIDQVEMIKATQATFKLGIEFVDWRDLGTSYIHGFGKIGQDMLWLHPHQLWLKMTAKGQARHFDHYALNCMAARKNRFCPPDPRQTGSPLADIDYAFHFDASLFAAFLRKESEKRGVERIEGHILSAERDGESGLLSRLLLADGRTIAGDLFIDCSGMRGLLIGDILGVGYEDWGHWLPCNRAFAVPSESAPVLTPYTRSTARPAGWQWRIPLQHRTGNGIVFSSDHWSDDEAAAALLANLDGKALGEPRLVRFRPGMRARSWDRNVVAIGLASGFLEPLESTSIHLIQTAILRLVALFPGTAFNPTDIAEYNRQTAFEYCDVRDFIIAHYKVTDREDTAFWRYVKHMEVPDSLAERLALFRDSARFFVHGKAELFREESWVQVLIGQGLDMHYDPMVDMIPEAEVANHLRDIEEVIADVAERMPRHEDFIARQCRAPAILATG
ncbi:tryptophan halogenase family protein [Sphingosinicella sp. BN140058]|uniref:tryptophan halogenase family protein n=1 Tax=Sphingosinicella sp. BN140058 TaxID=1892855 RepID=UPI0010133041|nr:tryptophan halogenase family protein [Sphingosinicella sp. BN140058]QAY78098.1 tryptophan 7-halogenase [Sphingosinicella sp. BN140058]